MFGTEISIPEGLLITLISMVVVFVILLCISYLIDLTNSYTRISTRPKKEQLKTTNTKPNAESPRMKEDNSQTAILAAAAIAAYLGRSADNLVVKSIRRLPDTDSTWSKADKMTLN